MKTIGLALIGCVFLNSCGGLEPDQPSDNPGQQVSTNNPGEANMSEELGQKAEALIANAGSIEDPLNAQFRATQCKGMHCCPDGYAMQGAHLAKNFFRCVRLSNIVHPGDENASCVVDHPGETVPRFGMHNCKKGYYMKGYHQGANLLTCCKVPGEGIFGEFPDGNPATIYFASQWATLAHTCPDFGSVGGSEYVMTGIHAGNNTFQCGI